MPSKIEGTMHLEALREEIEANLEVPDVKIVVAYQRTYPLMVRVQRCELVQDEETGENVLVLVAHDGNEYLPGWIQEKIEW